MAARVEVDNEVPRRGVKCGAPHFGQEQTPREAPEAELVIGGGGGGGDGDGGGGKGVLAGERVTPRGGCVPSGFAMGRWRAGAWRSRRGGGRTEGE